MKYTHILWDWNGTLLDDVGISIDCVNVLLKKLKKEPTDLKEYYQMMEIPLQKYYENLFNSRKMQFEYKLCTKNFQETYPKFIDNASLMNGAKEMLEFFKEQGCKQFIVSSFEKNYLTEYVNKFGVADYFEEISGDDDIHCAPKSQRALDLVKSVDKEKMPRFKTVCTDKHKGCHSRERSKQVADQHGTFFVPLIAECSCKYAHKDIRRIRTYCQQSCFQC